MTRTSPPLKKSLLCEPSVEVPHCQGVCCEELGQEDMMLLVIPEAKDPQVPEEEEEEGG